jgi:hypothetical protein
LTEPNTTTAKGENVIPLHHIREYRAARIENILQDIKRGLALLYTETRDDMGVAIIGGPSCFGDIAAIALAGRVLYGRVKE